MKNSSIDRSSHVTPSPWPPSHQKRSPPKTSVYFPIANSMCKQWVSTWVFYGSQREFCHREVYFKFSYFLFLIKPDWTLKWAKLIACSPSPGTLREKVIKMAVWKFWFRNFGKNERGKGPSFPPFLSFKKALDFPSNEPLVTL